MPSRTLLVFAGLLASLISGPLVLSVVPPANARDSNVSSAKLGPGEARAALQLALEQIRKEDYLGGYQELLRAETLPQFAYLHTFSDEVKRVLEATAALQLALQAQDRLLAAATKKDVSASVFGLDRGSVGVKIHDEAEEMRRQAANLRYDASNALAQAKRDVKNYLTENARHWPLPRKIIFDPPRVAVQVTGPKPRKYAEAYVKNSENESERLDVTLDLTTDQHYLVTMNVGDMFELRLEDIGILDAYLAKYMQWTEDVVAMDLPDIEKPLTVEGVKWINDSTPMFSANREGSAINFSLPFWGEKRPCRLNYDKTVLARAMLKEVAVLKQELDKEITRLNDAANQLK